MLGAFGQIPINDYMIGRMAQGFRSRPCLRDPLRRRLLQCSPRHLPLIAFVYDRWGFDMLFRVLARDGGRHSRDSIAIAETIACAGSRNGLICSIGVRFCSAKSFPRHGRA